MKKHGEYFSSIRDEICSIENLEFHERVDRRELMNTLSKSRCNIITSKYKGGWPSTFYEASARLVPTISLHFDSDNLFTDHEIGIFCNSNFDFMNQKFKSIIDDDKQLDKYGFAAYKYLYDNHSISDKVAALSGILIECK